MSGRASAARPGETIDEGPIDRETTPHVVREDRSREKNARRRLARELPGLLLIEDRMLARLYPGEIRWLADYGRCSRRLRGGISDHLVDLLRGSATVVLDFPANTPDVRAWMRGVAVAAHADHELHISSRRKERAVAGWTSNESRGPPLEGA
jgi:hypothetical protein